MRHLEARDHLPPPEAPNEGPDGGFTQPPTAEIGVAFGAFLSFSAFLLCLSTFVIERRTAQHAGLIANPPCALQLPCLSFVGDVGGDQSPKVLLAHTPFRRFLS